MTREPARGPNAPATIEYEPRLVEEAVRFAIEHGLSDVPFARGVRLRYENRRGLARLYALAPDEKRETAFRRHFRELFEALGLDEAVAEWIETAPPLGTDLERILVRSARSATDEGAELWEDREHRGSGVPSYLVLSVQPRGLSRPRELRDRVLPSLQRAAARVASHGPDGNDRIVASPAVASRKTRCPLCRFPTTDWAPPALLVEIAPSVEADFPDWTPAERCCGHCAERYQTLIAGEQGCNSHHQGR